MLRDGGVAAASGEKPLYIAEVGRGETWYAAGWHLKVRFVSAGDVLSTHAIMGGSQRKTGD